MRNRISSIQDTSVAGRQTRFAAVWWWRLARLLTRLWRVQLLNLLRLGRRPIVCALAAAAGSLLRLGRRPFFSLLRLRRRRPVGLLRLGRRPVGLLRLRRRPGASVAAEAAYVAVSASLWVQAH